LILQKDMKILIGRCGMNKIINHPFIIEVRDMYVNSIPTFAFKLNITYRIKYRIEDELGF